MADDLLVSNVCIKTNDNKTEVYVGIFLPNPFLTNVLEIC